MSMPVCEDTIGDAKREVVVNEQKEQKEEEERDPRCSIVLVLSSSLSPPSSSSSSLPGGVHRDHDHDAAARDFVRRVISLSDANSNGNTTTTTPLTSTSSSNPPTPLPTSNPPAPSPSNPPTTETNPTAIPHTLRNRYYDAEVWFWIVHGGVEGVGRALRASSGGRGASSSVKRKGGKDSGKEQGGEGDGGFGRFEGFEGASWSESESESESGSESRSGSGSGSGSDEDEGREEEKTKGMKHAPAIIYLWAHSGNKGNGTTHPREREIGALARGMRRAGWDPEVCLAVRVGGVDGGDEGDAVERKGDGEEGDVDGMFMEHGFEYVDARDRDGDGDREEEEDVPRLPRVLDALSTVMWVSMRAKDKSSKGKAAVRVRVTDNDEDQDQENEEEILRELMDVAALHHQSHNPLEGGEEFEFGEMVSSPIDYDVDAGFLSPFGLGTGVRRKVSMGFEDDFVGFSASHSGGYVVLDPDDDQEDEEEEDEDLPSKDSIKRTASDIFAGASGDGDGDLTDISSIFTSLQGMRANIARLESEDERRSVAARVALGVVYGLNLDVDRDREG